MTNVYEITHEIEGWFSIKNGHFFVSVFMTEGLENCGLQNMPCTAQVLLRDIDSFYGSGLFILLKDLSRVLDSCGSIVRIISVHYENSKG